MSKLSKVFKEPLYVISVIKSILLGKCLPFWWKISGKRVSVGKDFRINGWVTIKGPGKVIIGNKVRTGMLVTPWTFSKDAVITIGDGTYLNGTRFACMKDIRIGNNCILADARLMDTDFHNVNPYNRHVTPEPKPIILEDNVWLTIQTVILKGAHIGEGTTVTPNSVVHSKVPKYCIWGGNPGRVIRSFV